jgi:hypothetical protein
MSGLEPIIIGAAIGAGTSALTGGDPLKGAVLGGATGGITGGGGVGGLFGSSSASSGAASGAAAVPNAAAGAAGQAGLLFNPATGSFLNPEYYALASSANPIYTGAGSLGSQIATGAQSIAEGEWDFLKQYMPSGQSLANLGISSMQPRPTMQAPAGGVSKGTPPNIAAVEDLIKKRRAQTAQPTGLMGNYFG